MNNTLCFIPRRLAWLGFAAAAMIAAAPVHAAAPAGSQIGNQASATYADSASVTRTVTSNTVITTVQQVGSVSFTANGTKSISAGGQVYYPHTIVNTGNGTDTFALTSSATGTFSFATTLFYADANGDGIPDNAVPIISTGQMTSGQVFKFVAAGVVPPTAINGNTNATTLTATSAFAGGVTGTVLDTTTVTGQAVIYTTQALDITSGPSSGQRTITMTYTNTGNTTATNLVLTELLPSGMAYVGSSARWSVTGGAVPLTDADPADNQSGIVYDHGVTLANRVTATVASVPAGTSGTLSFKVTINSGLPAGALPATAATAYYAYNDGAAPVLATAANTVQYTVVNSASVTVGNSTQPSATQGGTVNFTNTITNTGNAIDSFDISVAAGSPAFPVGTTFQMFQADGVTPLVDNNGNGTPDTGPMAAGAVLNIVIRATLPSGATGGPYNEVVTATSRNDATKTGQGTDTLTTISGNTLDITLDTAGGVSPGIGAGPEGSPVSSPTVSPGHTLRYTIVAANGAGAADSFGLQASTDVNFATQTLPSGWTVTFRDGAGAIIDNTGVVAASSNKTVYADVFVPSGTAAGTTQLYFRAASAATGAADRLHTAVVVNTVRSLSIAPNHSGQTTAGGTAVYVHIVTNTGNVLEGDAIGSTGLVTSTDSAPGFTSIVYWDRNNDGTLDPSDPVITTLAGLTGGSNGASTAAGLTPGETARLFVKVTAPAGAAPSTGNVSTLTVTLAGTISSIVAPAASFATDSTTVIASQVMLVKTQAIDAACDGTADTAFSLSSILSGAAPGGCIRYEITATNAGAATITGLVINDATPAYTTYSATVPAASSVGSVTAPTNGTTGSIQATIASLAPGQTAVLRFGVRIDP